MEDIQILRKLTIRCFHINKVEFADKTYIKDKVLFLKKSINENMLNKNLIKSIEIKIISPNNRGIFINSIIDFYPIATKALGKLGSGITHVLTGVVVMITGVDEKGIQVAEFGSSEGILNEQVKFNRAGTPNTDDIIININVTLKDGMGTDRNTIKGIHKLSDLIINDVRFYMKNLKLSECSEKFEYYDKIKNNAKKVLIVKQVAGQGAMYDTLILPKEPCSSLNGKSTVDIDNIPVILTPNEYRDGALRAMY